METGTLSLLIGPVGAGKSTWARRWIVRHPALFLDLDRWMVRLYGEDERPDVEVMAWYLERRERARGLLWEIATESLRCGTDVVLELGLVTAAEREAAYRTAEAEDLPAVVRLIDAPRDVRRARVAERNLQAGPYTQIVPPAFFEAASELWEPVTGAERERWGIRSS